VDGEWLEPFSAVQQEPVSDQDSSSRGKKRDSGQNHVQAKGISRIVASLRSL
jgi:hypothetical protein